MGSDFYDKLLILQALRPHFPNAIFFTTDMDARFLDPQFERWTRNLLVASSFGLNLVWHVQRNAPPFRGSYQTSLFYATLGALDVQGNRLDHPPVAQRFEIGRLHAVNLSPKADPMAVQPSSKRRASRTKITLWFSLAGIGGWLLVIFAPPFRNTFKPHERNYERQKAILFTEDDILWSDGAIPDEPLPPGFGGLPKYTPPFTRATLALWLNGVFVTPLYPAVAVSESKLRHLSGRWSSKLDQWINLLPFHPTKYYREQMERTERFARWRLVIEARLRSAVGTCEERCRVLNAKQTGAYVAVVVAVLLAAAFLRYVVWSHVDPSSEPFSLFDGVSAWPCEILRLIALMLTVVFACKARLEVRADEARISERFGLRRVHRISFWRLWKQCWRVCRQKYGWFAMWLTPLGFWWEIDERFPSIGWRELKRQVSAEQLWRGYRDRSRALPRLLRSGVHLGLYAIFCLLLVRLAGAWMFVPARGCLARGLDATLLPLTVIAFLYLNFLVADAVRLARTCILLLCNGPTEWPQLAPAEGAKTVAFPSTPYQNTPVEWRDILFIAQLTRKVAPLVYYPAIILCLLVVARTRYFGNWSWPPALVIIFALNSIWPVASAFLLQTAAKRARTDAVASLESRLAHEQAKIAQQEKEGSVERVLTCRISSIGSKEFMKALLEATWRIRRLRHFLFHLPEQV